MYSLDTIDDAVDDDGNEKPIKRVKRNDSLITKSYPAAASLAREIDANLEYYLSNGLGCKQTEYGKAAVMVSLTSLHMYSLIYLLILT